MKHILLNRVYFVVFLLLSMCLLDKMRRLIFNKIKCISLGHYLYEFINKNSYSYITYLFVIIGMIYKHTVC